MPTVRSDYGIVPDFLTVTFAPNDTLLTFVLDCVSYAGYARTQGDQWSDKQVFHRRDEFSPVPTGSVFVQRHENWWLLSFSGGAIRHIDLQGELVPILAELSIDPSVRVSRLDLCRDIPKDSVSAVAHALRTVERLGNRGQIALGQKPVPWDQVKSQRTARQEPHAPSRIIHTGSVYVGDRSNVFSAIVYDKRAQMAERHDIDIGCELVRYEMRIRKGTATLRDVVEPDALFFRLASPDLMPRPVGVPKWERTEMDPRTLPPVERLTDYERLVRMIDQSSDLQTIRKLLERNPNAAPMAITRIDKLLRVPKKDVAA